MRGQPWNDPTRAEALIRKLERRVHFQRVRLAQLEKFHWNQNSERRARSYFDYALKMVREVKRLRLMFNVRT